MTTVADILGPQGRIAKRLPGYEARAEQIAMAEAVAEAIREERHLMVEAGTGVGKSFAYLVPALLAATAKKTPKRIIVSTNTISLQEQLINKDVPFLRSIWPQEFSAVLVKGRGNYLSRRRALVAADRASKTLLETQSHEQLGVIMRWMESTHDGSRSDLPFSPAPEVWEQVASEHGNCLGKACPEYDRCFYYAARKRVWNANLLVVNHSLFFSDLALRQQNVSILPNYDIVVFDEGHTLEDAAASHIGLKVSSTQVEFTLNRLYNEKSQKGLLIAHNLKELCEQLQQTRYDVRDFFNAVANWQANFGSRNGRVRAKGIVENLATDPLLSLARAVSLRAESIEKETERIELTAAAGRLQALGLEIGEWLQQKAEETVYWIETGNRGRVVLSSSPIELGALFQGQLWSTVPTAIVTSATLRTGGHSDEFHFFKSRLGMQQTPARALGSPFNYQKQTRLHLHPNVPDPSADPSRYEQTMLRLIPRYIEMTQGHAFVLFTSYKALKTASYRLTDWFASKRYPLFSQGDGMPRSKMLSEFRRTPHSVLFGTDSFWQGVDVQGEALQCVIITKLPFSVPDRPVIEARQDALRSRGMDPFREYSLPEATLKLTQGFGRLIRTRTDAGHVAILDPRVLTKAYGRAFLDALPDCPREVHRE